MLLACKKGLACTINQDTDQAPHLDGQFVLLVALLHACVAPLHELGHVEASATPAPAHANAVLAQPGILLRPVQLRLEL